MLAVGFERRHHAVQPGGRRHRERPARPRNRCARRPDGPRDRRHRHPVQGAQPQPGSGGVGTAGAGRQETLHGLGQADACGGACHPAHRGSRQRRHLRGAGRDGCDAAGWTPADRRRRRRDHRDVPERVDPRRRPLRASRPGQRGAVHPSRRAAPWPRPSLGTAEDRDAAPFVGRVDRLRGWRFRGPVPRGTRRRVADAAVVCHPHAGGERRLLLAAAHDRSGARRRPP